MLTNLALTSVYFESSISLPTSWNASWTDQSLGT